MHVPADVIETVGDDKDLLAIKQAIQVEINKRLKDLEERENVFKIIDYNYSSIDS